MALSTELASYNPALQITQTLLPENIASMVTAITLATRLSLRCSSLLIEALLETVKYSTSFSLCLSRQALVNALSSIKALHWNKDKETTDSNDQFLQILEKYTNLGVYFVYHTFTLAELFALSGLQLTSQAIKSGLSAAEESVSVIDGIFGSNETSRAIASIVSLVHKELLHDPHFELAKVGKVAMLSGLTKAMTAFAVLQNVTHKRTMKHAKSTVLWKGLVIEEETDPELSQLQSSGELDEQQTEIIHELESMLSVRDDNGDDDDQSDSDLDYLEASPEQGILSTRSTHHTTSTGGCQAYEISTLVKVTTTKTTQIRPLASTHAADPPRTKYIVQRTDEEDRGSYVAVLDRRQPNVPSKRANRLSCEQPKLIQSRMDSSDDRTVVGRPRISGSGTRAIVTSPKGFKIMLSAVTRKLSRKKVEREEHYVHLTENRQFEENSQGIHTDEGVVSGCITTVRSTSTTTLHKYATDLCDSKGTTGSHKRPPDTSPGDLPTMTNRSQTNHTLSPKRRPSWDRLKFRINRKKSSSSLFQKGPNELRKKIQQLVPPVPPVPKWSWPHRDSQDMSVTPTGAVMIHRSNSCTSIASIPSSITRNSTAAPAALTSISPPSSSKSKQRLVKCPSAAPLGRRKAKRPPLDLEPSRGSFPRKHIIHNISRFVKYASAAYGESFMRILGIGDIPKLLPSSYRHHRNHHAFSCHAGVMVEDILLSSYTDHSVLTVQNQRPHSLVHYVTVDHAAQAIVLTCRGTLGLSDILTDLTCEYCEFSLPSAPSRVYTAHSGMLEAAQVFAKQKGKVFQVIFQGLEKYPTYGLVLCGHSLGAGVASLLSVLWSQENGVDDDLYPLGTSDAPLFVTSTESGLPPGRPIHCYTFGPPCVMSFELSEYCSRGLVTSVVHAFDIVSSLSLGILKDFKNVAVSLHEESGVTDQILKRIIGRFQRKKDMNEQSELAEEDKQTTGDHRFDQDENDDDDQWFWAMIKTMRADMCAEKLYPPGTVYIIESEPQLVKHATTTKQHRQANMVTLRRCDDIQTRFSEITFSRTMFMDHSPTMYEKAILRLTRGVFG